MQIRSSATRATTSWPAAWATIRSSPARATTWRLADRATTSDNSYNDRVDYIKFGGGRNGTTVLNAITVHDDNAIDWLYGDGDLDWFLTGRKDKIKDRTLGERVNSPLRTGKRNRHA